MPVSSAACWAVLLLYLACCTALEPRNGWEAKPVSPNHDWAIYSDEHLSFGHQTEFNVGGYHPGADPNNLEDLPVPSCDRGFENETRLMNGGPSTPPRAAVCVFDRRNFFSHLTLFPHAAQNVLPCWSQIWYQHPDDRWVLLLREETGLKLAEGQAWTRQILERLGVLVIDADTQSQELKQLCGDHVSIMRHLPHTHKVALRAGQSLVSKPLDHDIEWLKSPSHATAMRETVLDDSMYKRESSDGKFRVGLLDRLEGAGRHLTNVEETKVMLTSMDQVGNVDIVTFDNLTAVEQAAWVANHDIIIAAHGAAITNIVFALPCTVLLDLFPKTYFWPTFYGTLATESGVEYFWMYPGSADEATMYSPIATPQWGKAGRDSTIDFSADQIKKAMPELFEARLNCISFGQTGAGNTLQA